jgi:protein TonB
MKYWNILASIILHLLFLLLLQLKSPHPLDQHNTEGDQTPPLFSVKVIKHKSLVKKPEFRAQPSPDLAHTKKLNPANQDLSNHKPEQITHQVQLTKPKKQDKTSSLLSSSHQEGDELIDHESSSTLRNEITTLQENEIGTFDSYFSQIKIKIQQHLEYPLLLRKQGIEGVVLLQFVLDQGGALIETKIIRTSGHPELDQLAVRAIEKSSPFTSQKKMGRAQLTLPIRFKLTI